MNDLITRLESAMAFEATEELQSRLDDIPLTTWIALPKTQAVQLVREEFARRQPLDRALLDCVRALKLYADASEDSPHKPQEAEHAFKQLTKALDGAE